MSELREIMDMSLESVAAVLILVLAYKIYKIKITTTSQCLNKDGNGVAITTENSGGEDLSIP